MIYYFTSTGNSKYTAERIAEAIGDEAGSIVGLDAATSSDEVVGIVSPTYMTGLPHIVGEFLSTLKLENCKYFFILMTYGTVTRVNYKDHTDLEPDALFSIKYPDDATFIFDLSDKDKVQKTLDKSMVLLDDVIDKIKAREKGNFVKNQIPSWAAKLYHSTYEGARKTSTLSVDDNCIGCGLCARNCPVKAIEIVEKKPVWVKDKCEMCLNCLHHCPKFAIHRGPKTAKHGQYDIKKYSVRSESK